MGAGGPGSRKEPSRAKLVRLASKEAVTPHSFSRFCLRSRQAAKAQPTAWLRRSPWHRGAKRVNTGLCWGVGKDLANGVRHSLPGSGKMTEEPERDKKGEGRKGDPSMGQSASVSLVDWRVSILKEPCDPPDLLRSTRGSQGTLATTRRGAASPQGHPPSGAEGREEKQSVPPLWQGGNPALTESFRARKPWQIQRRVVPSRQM